MRPADVPGVRQWYAGLPASERARVASVDDADPSDNGSDDPLASSWAEVDLAETVAGLIDGSLRPPEPTICRRSDASCLFYAGRINSVFGDSTAGKTWLALEASRQEIETGHHVVFLDLEDSAVLTVDRLLCLGTDAQEVIERFHYVNPEEPFGMFAQDRLRATLDDHDPTLVVIDSTGESMAIDGVKTNLDEDVARWNRRLPRWIARRGAGVVLLDHVPKDPANRAGPSGSHRKRDMVTGSSFLIEAVREFGRDELGVAKLTTAKDRCGFHVRGRLAATFTLDACPEVYTVELEAPQPTEDGAEFVPTVLMEKVSRYLELRPDGASKRDLRGLGKHSYVDLAIASWSTSSASGSRRGAKVTCTTRSGPTGMATP
jgi:hypothetical protein